MTKTIAKISNSREVKDLHETLKRLHPYVVECIDEGCGISPFAKSFADRVLKTKHKDNPILSVSAFTWTKGSRKRTGVDSFEIESRSREYSGVFLSVKRSLKEDVSWSKSHSLGLAREFYTLVAERLKYRTPVSTLTQTALGDALKQLIGLGKYLVSLKVDNGIHLVFKETIRSNRYLEVYIGGWFDEAKFPLENYSIDKIINRLRKTEDSKEFYHGSNKCAYAHPAAS